MRFAILPSLMIILCGAAVAPAQTTQPTLEALDRGVQELYQDVQQSIVRVVVPLQFGPRLMQDHPLQKWMPRLDPKVREQLEQPREGQAVRVYVEKPLSTTQPIEIERNGGPGAIAISPLQPVVVAEFLGLILNEHGDVLLPLFVDKSLVGDLSLRVMYGDNQVTTAKLVGGDRQTNLSVVKLAKAVGSPVKMSEKEVSAGALVLLLSPTRRQARLSMWTGGQDEHAVVFNASGDVAGLVRYGHMLEPYAFVPVARQLSESGTVKRAVLGVLIREVGAEDPERLHLAATLGARPAAKVEVVEENSTAQQAGVQKGDLILSLGGDPVNDVAHFAAALSRRQGSTELKILRNGQEMTLTVDLQPR